MCFSNERLCLAMQTLLGQTFLLKNFQSDKLAARLSCYLFACFFLLPLASQVFALDKLNNFTQFTNFQSC